MEIAEDTDKNGDCGVDRVSNPLPPESVSLPPVVANGHKAASLENGVTHDDDDHHEVMNGDEGDGDEDKENLNDEDDEEMPPVLISEGPAPPDLKSECLDDPNFATICSFMGKFGHLLKLEDLVYDELQVMLEETTIVPEPLAKLHILLLRRVFKSIQADKWEKMLARFGHSYCSQDGWEIERFGYKKAKLQTKLRLLKNLLEAQFDYNIKFKMEVNKLAAGDLRLLPLGQDCEGQLYWYQVDNDANLRVYKEDVDDESWQIVAFDREGLCELISKLQSGDVQRPVIDILVDEDSNSNSNERMEIDMKSATPPPPPPENKPPRLEGAKEHLEEIKEEDEGENKLEHQIKVEQDKVDIEPTAVVINSVSISSSSVETKPPVLKIEPDVKNDDNVIPAPQVKNTKEETNSSSDTPVPAVQPVEKPEVVEPPCVKTSAWVCGKKEGQEESETEVAKQIDSPSPLQVSVSKKDSASANKPSDGNAIKKTTLHQPFLEAGQEDKPVTDETDNITKMPPTKENSMQETIQALTTTKDTSKKTQDESFPLGDTTLDSSSSVPPLLPSVSVSEVTDHNSKSHPFPNSSIVEKEETSSAVVDDVASDNQKSETTASPLKEQKESLITDLSSTTTVNSQSASLSLSSATQDGQEPEPEAGTDMNKSTKVDIDVSKLSPPCSPPPPSDIVTNSSGPLFPTVKEANISKEPSAISVSDPAKDNISESSPKRSPKVSEPTEIDKSPLTSSIENDASQVSDKPSEETAMEDTKISKQKVDLENANIMEGEKEESTKCDTNEKKKKDGDLPMTNPKKQPPTNAALSLLVAYDDSESSSPEGSPETAVSDESTAKRKCSPEDESCSTESSQPPPKIRKEEKAEEVPLVGEAIEESIMIVTGEGSGAACEGGNDEVLVENQKENIAENEEEEEEEEAFVPAKTRRGRPGKSASPSKPKAVKERPPKPPSVSPAANKRRKKGELEQLGVPLDTLEINGGISERPVRASSRIAQIRLKEEEERRKLEEERLAQLKAAQLMKKQQKKVETTDMKVVHKQLKDQHVKDYEPPSASSAEDSGEEFEIMAGKKKRGRKGKKIKPGGRPWATDSDDDDEDEAVEEEEECHYEEEEHLVYNESDHEFSPESDLGEDDSAGPSRHARTAKRGEIELEQEAGCKKCGKGDHPEWILLCDKCDDGWHASCLRPQLWVVPEGEWFCPPCQHAMLISKLNDNLVEYDKLLKKRENEVLHKKRLTYVGISLENVLPEPDKEEEEEEFNDGERKRKRKKREREKRSSRRRRILSDEELSDNFVASDRSSSGLSRSVLSEEEDSDGPIYRLRTRGRAKTFDYKAYDDMINSACRASDEEEYIEEEVVEADVEADVEDNGVAEEGEEMAPPPVVESGGKNDAWAKQMEAAAAGEEEEETDEELLDEKEKNRRRELKKGGGSKRKKRSFRDLDDYTDEDNSDEDFKGSDEENDDEPDEEVVEESEESEWSGDKDDSDDSIAVAVSAKRDKKSKYGRREQYLDVGTVRRSTRAKRRTKYDESGESDEEEEVGNDKWDSEQETEEEETPSESDDETYGKPKRRKPTPKPSSSKFFLGMDVSKPKKSGGKKKKKRGEEEDVDRAWSSSQGSKMKKKAAEEKVERKTRGRKINFKDILDSGESDDDGNVRPKRRRISSGDEEIDDEDEAEASRKLAERIKAANQREEALYVQRQKEAQMVAAGMGAPGSILSTEVVNDAVSAVITGPVVVGAPIETPTTMAPVIPLDAGIHPPPPVSSVPPTASIPSTMAPLPPPLAAHTIPGSLAPQPLSVAAPPLLFSHIISQPEAKKSVPMPIPPMPNLEMEMSKSSTPQPATIKSRGRSSGSGSSSSKKKSPAQPKEKPEKESKSKGRKSKKSKDSLSPSAPPVSLALPPTSSSSPHHISSSLPVNVNPSSSTLPIPVSSSSKKGASSAPSPHGHPHHPNPMAEMAQMSPTSLAMKHGMPQPFPAISQALTSSMQLEMARAGNPSLFSQNQGMRPFHPMWVRNPGPYGGPVMPPSTIGKPPPLNSSPFVSQPSRPGYPSPPPLRIPSPSNPSSLQPFPNFRRDPASGAGMYGLHRGPAPPGGLSGIPGLPPGFPGSHERFFGYPPYGILPPQGQPGLFGVPPFDFRHAGGGDFKEETRGTPPPGGPPPSLPPHLHHPHPGHPHPHPHHKEEMSQHQHQQESEFGGLVSYFSSQRTDDDMES